jgi:hypothetical protein
MCTSIKSSKLVTNVAASTVAILLGFSPGTAFASGQRDYGNATPPPMHGPGSSHNPIVYHPVHGPGSSHNPIVRHCPPRGTVVHDHRNGRDCSYVAGDSQSYNQYRRCEGLHYGGKGTGVLVGFNLSEMKQRG